eukprot:scaffold105743_cov65-Phaeocystis_antarctica.AAC.1
MYWSQTESSKWSLDRVSTRPGHPLYPRARRQLRWVSGSEPSGLSSRGRPSRTAESVRYGLLTPRHLLRPPRLHVESRGHTLLLGRHVLLQANHLEEEEEEEEEEGG